MDRAMPDFEAWVMARFSRRDCWAGTLDKAVVTGIINVDALKCGNASSGELSCVSPFNCVLQPVIPPKKLAIHDESR